jgi:hypothetical protein
VNAEIAFYTVRFDKRDQNPNMGATEESRKMATKLSADQMAAKINRETTSPRHNFAPPPSTTPASPSWSGDMKTALGLSLPGNRNSKTPLTSS